MVQGIAAHRWMMTAVNQPMVREAFVATAGEGEVVVAVAGCGVCHTDLGYFYDGVRTNHPLALALGHEISGRVVATGSRCPIVARSRRDHSRGAAMWRMRHLQARSSEHLPQTENARQRHPGRLRLAYRRARARPLPGG